MSRNPLTPTGIIQYDRQIGTAGTTRTASLQSRFAAVLAALVPHGPVGGRSNLSIGPYSPDSPGQSNPAPGAYDPLFKAAADREGIDEHLLEAVAEAESGFRPDARSKAGAIGVMQLMPSTAKSLGVNPYDPAANIAGGARYLKTMLDRFGSLPLALAAYNAGPGAVEKFKGVPPYQETMTYVNRVLQLAQRNEQSAAKEGKEGDDGERPLA